MKKTLIISFLTLYLASPAASWAIPLGFEIGPYSSGGFSASWLHSADGSPGTSDLDLDNSGSNDTLYMSPGPNGVKITLTGMLGGDWDGTILSNITGMLNGSSMITGGSLGGAYYDVDMNPLWYLDLNDGGTFYFEEINGMINQINENYLLLWGQNEAAYAGEDGSCYSSQCTSQTRWGMDLYGKAQSAQSLPEPGTLMLMMFGLASLVVTSRRRAVISSRN